MVDVALFLLDLIISQNRLSASNVADWRNSIAHDHALITGQMLAEELRDQPARNIGVAAQRKADDHGDGPVLERNHLRN
jgi:hypothetical protein